jgi:hypothetical protein
VDYRVVLHFEAEASFEVEVSADGQDMARRIAERIARDCGWESAVCGHEITPLRRQKGEV